MQTFKKLILLFSLIFLFACNQFEKNDKSILFIEWPQIIKNEPHSVNKLYFEYENEYQNRFIKL